MCAPHVSQLTRIEKSEIDGRSRRGTEDVIEFAVAVSLSDQALRTNDGVHVKAVKEKM